MDWSGCEIVEVVTGKVSGVPLIRNSRVPSLDAGETVEQVAFNYDLKPEDVLCVKLFRDSHQPSLRR